MNNPSFIPRFQGKAFQVNNGCSWEILVVELGNNEKNFTITTEEIFTTKKSAIKNMTAVIKLCCDTFQKKSMGEVTGKYIDMKTKETLNWDKSKQN
jgi:hypothetical protein